MTHWERERGSTKILHRGKKINAFITLMPSDFIYIFKTKVKISFRCEHKFTKRRPQSLFLQSIFQTVLRHEPGIEEKFFSSIKIRNLKRRLKLKLHTIIVLSNFHFSFNNLTIGCNFFQINDT